jgi:hypothetical protein
MSFDSTQWMVCCGVWASGLVGTSVPTWPRLRGPLKGIGDNVTKSKTKGGGATPHACPNKIQLQNTK